MSTETDKTIADRGMGLGLKALNRLAGSDLLDRIEIRKQVEKIVYRTTKNGFRTATAAGRTFKAAQKLGKPARQARGKSTGLFDVSPDDEQQMFQEAGRAFAEEKIRPAALEADAACATPPELLAQAAELGVNMLGVPEELGGVMHEQAAVTSVLIGEALAHGDLGIAYAALAPGAVATAIGHWGSAEQQATYLPAFTGEDVPAAALAILEPRPLFDPLKLETKARREGGDWILDGTKSLVARAAECELFVVAAERADEGPALFVIESGAEGLSVEAEPAMGLRPAATGRLILEGVRLPAERAARRGQSRGLRRVRQPRPHRLVRARGRHRAGGPRLRDPLRQRAHRLRRTDLQPPGGRLRGLRHRHRDRRHAARRPTAPRAAPTAARTSPARPRSPAGSAPPRACRSAPTACSCSAATASSRSTRSSAGTATSAQRASWRAPCSSRVGRRAKAEDDQPRDTEEVQAARQPGPPGRDRGLPPDLPQVRRGRARLPERARHARRADRRHERRLRARRLGRRRACAARAGDDSGENRNGTNLSTVLGIIELCWGDVGLLLTMPRQGLGNSAIASVATEEQLEHYGGKWAAMAITEPEAGSDSAAIRTTAELDGDEYVLNGEKIFVTSGDRADLIVVWATLDRSVGRAAIKSFIVERDNPGLKLDRLEHKLGIRASDTANFTLQNCRVPKERAARQLRDRGARSKQGFGGAMQTFDNTRPLVAGMAVGVARAALEETRERLAEAGVEIDYSTPRALPARRRGARSSRWRPTTRPRCC